MKSLEANDLNFCTIISKNYLASARVLTKSLREQHPNAGIYVLLVDRLDGYFNADEEPFELFLIEELPIPQLLRFCFQYHILELNTATKPYFLRFLFDRFKMDKLVYLDPDIRVYQPMNHLNRVLSEVAIVLTPHILTPYPSQETPSEIDILRSGTFNLGFIGLSNKEVSYRLINWWEEKLFKGCVHDIDHGYMVDQKWIDLVPSFFEDLLIFRDNTYNVAYWNLHERQLSYSEKTLLVNGRPCVFFHFSGYSPSLPLEISKWQTRYKMKDLKDGALAYANYAKELYREGYNICKKWPYAFDYFDNGEPISTHARILYRELNDKVIEFRDPFKTSHPKSFYDYFKNHKLPTGTTHSQGVNLIGIFHSEKGTSEAVRCVYRALKESQVPCSVRNVDHAESENLEKIDLPFSENNAFKINLINFNADMSHRFTENADVLLSDRYNIGYWNWELETFPDCWLDSFSQYNEIWTPSSYTQKSIQTKSPIPVVHIPYSINIPKLPEYLNRSHFGLRANSLIFLFVFDCDSFIARKNPHAVIKAFQLAFDDLKDVQLVIKMMGKANDKKEIDSLKTLIGESENTVFIHKVFSRVESYALMSACDVFVSLHRCEGFGLNICEAMLMGKPVIATNYSANTDYMNDSNGYLVKYKKVIIDQDYGPYKKGEKWAEPDVQHAASLMKQIYENREEAKQKGLEAYKAIQTQYSDKAIGQKIKERIDMIHANMKNSKSNMLSAMKEQMNIINFPIISHRPFIGRGIVLMRKLIRWLIKPALEKQSNLNNMQYFHLMTLNNKVDYLEEQIENLQKMIKSTQALETFSEFE